MKKILFFALISCLGFSALAQTKTDYNKAADSDPKAKAIMEKVRKKYEGYKSMEASFTLEIQFPEQPKEVQKGKVARQGDKYRFELGNISAISDGKTLWSIMDNNKEVQVYNVPEEDEDDSILSPQSLFTFYKNGKFAYILVNEYSKSGKVVQEIEFKPLDRDFEYSKLRMTIDKSTAEVVNAMAFGKDGSRYTFTINQLTPNKTFAANHFTFDKAKFPGYHVEDLRY